MEKEIEFNEEDLDQIFGGIPYEVAIDKALNSENNHRQQQIEDLKELKNQLNELNNYHTNKSSKNR